MKLLDTSKKIDLGHAAEQTLVQAAIRSGAEK
jgi:hypothetical protein